jgi:uncharacterized protein (DUF433 family)
MAMTAPLRVAARAIKLHMDEDGMTFDEAAALYPKLTAENLEDIKVWLTETYGMTF